MVRTMKKGACSPRCDRASYTAEAGGHSVLCGCCCGARCGGRRKLDACVQCEAVGRSTPSQTSEWTMNRPLECAINGCRMLSRDKGVAVPLLWDARSSRLGLGSSKPCMESCQCCTVALSAMGLSATQHVVLDNYLVSAGLASAHAWHVHLLLVEPCCAAGGGTPLLRRGQVATLNSEVLHRKAPHATLRAVGEEARAHAAAHRAQRPLPLCQSRAAAHWLACGLVLRSTRAANMCGECMPGDEGL